MGVFSQQKTIDRLEDRIRSLELKCDDLERAKKSLDLEFTELYDKVSHQMSRMAKRYARAESSNENLSEHSSSEETVETTDPISKSILARRGIRRQAN